MAGTRSRIPCGNRIVFAEVGYKWTRVCTQNLDIGKLPTKEFKRSIKEKIELTLQQKKRARETIEKYLEYKDRTAFVKRILEWLS